MTDYLDINKIFNDWQRIKQQGRFNSHPLFEPQDGEIPGDPYSLRNAENYNNYKQNIRQYIEGEEYKKTTMPCYLYVTFRRNENSLTNKDQRLDVDNLLKGFFDAIKKDDNEPKNTTGILIKDDEQIIGVKANLIKLSQNKQGSVQFTLIPAYDVELTETVQIIKKGSGLDELHKLRKKYIAKEYSKPLKEDRRWYHPMQMVTTNLGTFFDSSKGSLWGVESYGERFLHKPEPGFDWYSKKKDDKIKGVVLFERSGCWWINKWAE